MSDSPTTTLSIADLGSERWHVTGLVAHERLFAPTRFVVTARTSAPVEPDDLIGLDATLAVVLDGASRTFSGVVLEASERADRDEFFAVELVVASKLALLSLGRDHRIYQEMTVQDVVSDVMSRAGLSDLCEWSVNTSYEPHDNIVQYGESDYAFVTRLLHEEGIGYFVEQREDGERVVFFDDDTVFTAIDGESVLEVMRIRSERRRGIRRLEEVHRVASDQVALRDYDPKSPGTDLTATAVAEGSTAREVYVHPGGYVNLQRGQRLADRLLERLRVRTRTLAGASDVLTLAPGRFFSVTGNVRPELDGDYVLVSVTHRLRQQIDESGGRTVDSLTYDNEFEVIPTGVPYRPQEAAPQPVIAGVQHAIVTVPAGEEIHADEHGRAKVRFLWDRSGITDDKSSTWLRVGQLALGGSMILPRVDFEVLVDFELGDLDRPAISGHLYNAEKPPPYALPAGKTVSSMQTATTEGGPGANELRFEDAAGHEEIFVNASKDLVASVDNDTSWSVGANQTHEVGGNETLSVTADHTTNVAGNRSLSIGGNQDVNVGAEYGDGTGGDLSVTIGGNRFVKAGGDHTEDVAGSLTRTVGSLQAITGLAGVTRTIVGNSSTDVAAAWAEMAGGARGLSISGSYTETVGALKFIKAKNVAVHCDAAYTMNGAAELVKAGGSRTDDAGGALALTAGGAFKIKAKNIVLEAKSKLVFRGGGGVIELTKAGTVKIKAPSITVKNAKALNQIMHKSN